MSRFGDDWEERNKALSLLARRINLDYNFLNEVHWTAFMFDKKDYFCLICKTIICSSYSENIYGNRIPSDLIDEHGLIHLKEYNLLALI